MQERKYAKKEKKWEWEEPCSIFIMKVEIHVFYFLLSRPSAHFPQEKFAGGEWSD